MAYSQKYTIIQLLEPMQVGDSFHMSSGPLHVTLADVFAIDLEGADFIQQLSNLAARKHPLAVEVGKDTVLGPPDQPVRVKLLENTPDLQSLHEAIIDLLESLGTVFNTPEYTRQGFKPHITVQHSVSLKEGDPVTINALTLIDMFPNADWQQRKILATSKLGQHE